MPAKKNVNEGGKAPVKVKQDMIDFIKSQGMAKALKRAGQLQAKGTKGEAEFIEGVRRMYGANRLSAATAKAKPAVTKPTDSRFSGVKKPDPTKPTDSRFTGIKKAASSTPSRKPAFGGTAAQKAQAAARAGGNINMNRTVSTTPAKKSPSKPYVQPKPTAAQMAQAKARAGGNLNLNPKPKAPETAAQKAAKVALSKKRREAVAAATKRAGGRTL